MEIRIVLDKGLVRISGMDMDPSIRETLSDARPGRNQIVVLAMDGEEVVGAYVKPKDGLGFISSKPGSGVGRDLSLAVLRELQRRHWRTEVQVGVGNVKSLRHHAILGYRVKAFHRHPSVEGHPVVLLNGVKFDDLKAVNDMLDDIARSRGRVDVCVDGEMASVDTWKSVPGMGTYEMDV